MCLPREGSKSRVYAWYPIHVRRLGPDESERLRLVTTLNAPKSIDSGAGTVSVELTGYDIHQMKTVTLRCSLTQMDPRHETSEPTVGTATPPSQASRPLPLAPRLHHVIVCHRTAPETMAPLDEDSVFTTADPVHMCCYVYDIRVGTRITAFRRHGTVAKGWLEYVETNPGSHYVRLSYHAGMERGTHKVDFYLDNVFKTSVTIIVK